MTKGKLLAVGCAALAMTACGLAGWVVGGLMGEAAAYRRQFRHERDMIAPVLAADPAFAGVEVNEYSGGGAYLTGTVNLPADLARLRAEVARLLGEPKAAFLLSAVDVAGGPGRRP